MEDGTPASSLQPTYYLLHAALPRCGTPWWNLRNMSSWISGKAANWSVLASSCLIVPVRRPSEPGDLTIPFGARPQRVSSGRPAIRDLGFPPRALPDQWMLECGCFRLQLRPTPFGHVGVFPEQLANWRWLQQQITPRPRPFRILNLFAYTGGSTLAAAAAGAEVVHVDAARNVVRWARENARLSGLQDKPIRWIAEDARKFVRREQKRGNQYHALILDPPSYGHGARGETWKLSHDLLPLLRMCSKILFPPQPFVLLTCHSPGFGPAEVAACLSEGIFGHCQVPVVSHSLCLTTRDGRRLPAGAMARGVGNALGNPAD